MASFAGYTAAPYRWRASLLESSEPDIAVRRAANVEGRRAIGRLIAEMVPDGAAVILGGGATLEAVAESLAPRRGLTVVTNSIPNCLKLVGRNGHRIHLLGGALQATNQTTLGGDAAEMLSKYYANFAIIGAGAISRQGEIMDYTLEEAELYRKMLRSAETAIVAADRSCFGSIALVRVDSLEEATYIVTDAEPEPVFTDVLDRLPVQLLVAASRAECLSIGGTPEDVARMKRSGMRVAASAPLESRIALRSIRATASAPREGQHPVGDELHGERREDQAEEPGEHDAAGRAEEMVDAVGGEEDQPAWRRC